MLHFLVDRFVKNRNKTNSVGKISINMNFDTHGNIAHFMVCGLTFDSDSGDSASYSGGILSNTHVCSVVTLQCFVNYQSTATVDTRRR